MSDFSKLLCHSRVYNRRANRCLELKSLWMSAQMLNGMLVRAPRYDTLHNAPVFVVPSWICFVYLRLTRPRNTHIVGFYGVFLFYVFHMRGWHLHGSEWFTCPLFESHLFVLTILVKVAEFSSLISWATDFKSICSESQKMSVKAAGEDVLKCRRYIRARSWAHSNLHVSTAQVYKS